MHNLNEKIKKNRGMSYIELIVVLGIFSVLTSIALFNYGLFQARVDIKNLASDLALKVIEAQKAALNGKLPVQTPSVSPWKPAYGVFIDKVADNKSFIYFADLNNNYSFDGSACTGECVEKSSITKGNYISSLDVFYIGGSTTSLNNLTISFKRPNSSAVLKGTPALGANIDYVQATVSSPKSATSNVKIYPSGRIQIN